MIKLVKNEITKILHKKGLYIFLTLILVIYGAEVIITNMISEVNFNNQYYANLSDTLKFYDLNDADDVKYYVYDKTEVEAYRLKQEHNITDETSAEAYYIDNTIKSLIYSKNVAEYEYKNLEEVENIQKELDQLIAKIDNYDWKSELIEEKNELSKQLKEEKDKNQIQILKDQITAIDYRINNNVPVSNSSNSQIVDNYLAASSQYNERNTVEKELTHEEKLEQMEIEKTYFENKYKIENNIVKSEKNFDITASTYTETNIFILIAILIVTGGIIAEEFNKGTVKQLFIRPFKRSKILISKIIASVIIVSIFTIILTIIPFVSDILMGTSIKALKDPIIIYNFTTGKIVEYSIFKYMFITLMSTLPVYIFYTTICLLVGIITTSTVASVIAVLGVELIPSMISFTQKIEAYLPYNCLNYNKYLFGGLSPNQYQTLTSSLVIMITTITILNIIMFYILKKKDIKNQ